MEEEGEKEGSDSDEPAIQVYYEPEEIDNNRAEQKKDQFEEIMNMKHAAAEPKKNIINIMDFIPVALKVKT